MREWRPLAEQGDSPAQGRLGLLYTNGQGVPRDHVQARQWYEKAAIQGDALAQLNLGVIYGNGKGVPEDYQQALYWFRLSANQGNAMAKTQLGLMYERGNGVPQDVVLAQKWYILGAANGDKLGAELRDALAKRMTPAQIFQAQQRVLEWELKSSGSRKANERRTAPNAKPCPLRKPTVSNMWEIRKTLGSNRFRTAITKLKSAPRAFWIPAGCL